MNLPPRRLSPHHLRGPILATVTTFVVLFSLAAHAYPGGTHFNRHAVGHDFWRNTLCDVARSRALDGAPNHTGALLARFAMTALAIGLGLLFCILPCWFARNERGQRLANAVRAMGIFFVPFAIAVVFLPTDRFSALHGLAIVLAGVPGLCAAILALTGLLRSDSHAPIIVKRLGLLAVSVAAIDFSIYVDEVARGGSARLSVVILERVATLLLLAWMLVVSHSARRLKSASPTTTPSSSS